MSGLEVAAGVIGITDVACKSLLNLYRFVKDIQDAPELINQIGNDIAALDKCLDSIVSIVNNAEPDLQTMLQKAGLPVAINDCATPCDQLRKDLERWTRSDSKALWSRIQVRAHKGRIESTLARIETAKNTVDLATDTATLLLVSKTSPTQGQTRTKQLELQHKISSLTADVRQKLELTETKSQDLQVLFNQDDSAENENALLEAENEKATYEQLWANYATISKQLTQNIGDVESSEAAEVSVGMPEVIVEKLQQQTIGNVKSGANAKVRVGIF